MKAPILMTAILCLLLMNSCNYFKNHRLFSRGVDSVLDMTIEQPEPVTVDSTEIMAGDNMLEPEITEEPEPEPLPAYSSGSDKYFMIVGSFQNQNLAQTYAEKIRAMGYQGEVIEASNGYYRVSAKSYSNYQQGISEIADFRASLSMGAWLHVRN